ncbi:F0F1 ATP synthase subunit delta [Enorma phocaeensis]|uniref:F0F1 ATP synthase subunit delta n=1 Tax=Enorma phocaeensis TaxID=1871019 RepID=UPI001EF3E591|nr:F0F1 ATP synthase subunit delta [Enorma phocaeensis]
MESAKADGRVFDDLKNLEVLAQASPELLAALSCMVTRGQLDMLPQVAEAFRAMADEDEDVVGVTVTTAIPLDDELRAKIRARLEQDLDREVFLIEQVDPTIIGGLVLEARGQRRDVSVKTQLRAARKTLVETTMKAGGDLA